ncbi:hypothetical protein DQ353_03025 [Arthrobacter sp. AQ5-05]|uniref:hypothetical protein n=1 Tax=Arthrobacter sp. AQ5-05 TaxID=2184581 RepID=UPI000DCBE29B|nr:hypothetical protein [Arthrobacter sp. AQ5-05]RAX50544.1 hypothetical protein DQ353_03025 [Arthrobacter sp. AQ5-05]
MTAPGPGTPPPPTGEPVPAPMDRRLPPPTGTRVRVSAPAGTMLNIARRSTPDAADTFYVHSLIRSQLRLAVSVALGFLLLLVGLAVMVFTWPEINNIRLATVPLPWWILGVGVYPLILISAFLYNKTAARNEAKYRSIAKP